MIITIQNATCSAKIDSIGAQLISLKDAAGKEYIWQRDPAYWGNCSPLLFPTVGNCRNGKTMIEGTWYEIPKHGFCKTTDFTVSQPSGECAVFTMCDSEETHRMYPYAFRLSLTYTLQADGVHMDYTVENTDDRTIHYHLGAHPGFICPLEDQETFSDYVLEFEQEETAASIVYDIPNLQFNMKNQKPLLNQTRTLALHYDLFVDDALFFDNINSRKVEMKNPKTGKGIEVDYCDFETVAFWTSMPSRGPFLCVEPWNGSAIRSDEDDNFLNRHYLQSVDKGMRKEYHLGIRIL